MRSRYRHGPLGPIIASSLLCALAVPAYGQPPAGQQMSSAEVQSKVDHLLLAVEKTEAQIQASQRELDQLKQELAQLRRSMAATTAPAATATDAAEAVSSSVGPTVEEQLSMQAAQIATLDQAKVESASKYPVRLRGTILFNSFVNTGRVDQPVDPSGAVGGNGSTGLSLRQTSLGFDAVGPRIWGAVSRAEALVDFFGSAEEATYNNAGGLVRLRIARASLAWKSTEVYFAYDRPLVSPYTPESLVAAAVPELAWSGNLWGWNPQFGVTHTRGSRTRVRLQATLIDPADPVYAADPNTRSSSSLAEASRWPGMQGRIAVLGRDDEHSASFGVGGYFSPHRISAVFPSNSGGRFNAWAGTADFRLPLSHGLQVTASAYRGQALGGLGGGGYRDYVFRTNSGALQVRGLEDVGGWTQVHQTVNARVSWNVGFGIDNPFVHQLRAFPGNGISSFYDNVARNRTVFANVLYSPKTYFILSGEYRNLRTAPVQGRLWTSNVVGVGAAYRF